MYACNIKKRPWIGKTMRGSYIWEGSKGRKGRQKWCKYLLISERKEIFSPRRCVDQTVFWACYLPLETGNTTAVPERSPSAGPSTGPESCACEFGRTAGPPLLPHGSKTLFGPWFKGLNPFFANITSFFPQWLWPRRPASWHLLRGQLSVNLLELCRKG